MPSLSPKNMPEEKKRVIRIVLSITGLFFMALGGAALSAPQGFSEVLGQDNNQIAAILGAAFLFIGISDIAIAQFIFKGNAKND